MLNFVYFDVGGVVMRDFSGTDNWDKLKKELGVKEKDFKKFDDIWERFEEEINIGRELSTVIPDLNKEMGLQIPSNLDLLNGFVSRFDKNETIWTTISEIKKYCKIGLLTNMYPGMFDAIVKRDLLPHISFDVIVDSSKEGVKKPYKEMYQRAEKMSGYNGSKILFIDNSKKNLEEPSNLGWNTYWYDVSNMAKSSQELLKYFDVLQNK